jgi:hypothetical protein
VSYLKRPTRCVERIMIHALTKSLLLRERDEQKQRSHWMRVNVRFWAVSRKARSVLYSHGQMSKRQFSVDYWTKNREAEPGWTDTSLDSDWRMSRSFGGCKEQSVHRAQRLIKIQSCSHLATLPAVLSPDRVIVSYPYSFSRPCPPRTICLAIYRKILENS